MDPIGILEDLKRRAAALDKADQAKRDKAQSDARRRWRPQEDSLPIRGARLPLGLYTVCLWVLFIGLPMLNNAGFWARYVMIAYLVLALPVMFFSRGWIQMLFAPPGELPDKEYRRTVVQCRASLTAITALWAVIAAAEGLYLILQTPEDTLTEWLFLGGSLAAAGVSLAARRYASGFRYAQCEPEDAPNGPRPETSPEQADERRMNP